MSVAAGMSKALTREQAARFQTAMQALKERRIADALEVATNLVGQAPDAPDAHQLLAICQVEAGRFAEAEAAFGRALALAPGSVPVLMNFAAYLRRMKRFDEAAEQLRLVVRVAPQAFPGWLQLGMTELDADRFETASEAFEQATRLQPGSALAWHGLGNSMRARHHLHEAEAALRRAVAASPGYGPAWVNLGAVLRLLGRSDEAVACFRNAARNGQDGPLLADAMSGALIDAGHPFESLENARQLILKHPDYVPGQVTYAHLLWEYGPLFAPGSEPLASFRRAVMARPLDRDMQLSYLRFLLHARKSEEVLERAQSLASTLGRDPVLTWMHADALAQLGRHEDAEGLYVHAHAAFGDGNPAFLNAYARHRLRTGQWRGAADLAHRATKVSPHDQDAWNNLGTAWRLLGDEREAWLFDYERIVGCVDIEPPAGYAGIQDFLVDLVAALDRIHQAGREPVNQSLRHGSQTPGKLFGRRDPAIAAVQHQLLGAIERWIAGLPDDPSHPFLSRKQRSVMFSGSWSVKLWSSGHHANHIHSEGWMSSAFYVLLPPSMAAGAGEDGTTAGCIQFGQPLEELGLDLPPRRIIRPRAGQVALFPSYTWHGTVPFSDEAPRVTIAFDMLPLA